MSIYTSWPSLTADKLYYDGKQFIADLAAASLDPTFEGKIKGDGSLSQKSLDQLKFDPAVFNNITDGRFSLGSVLSAIYTEFIPRLQARREIADAGGCQIINDYICDAEGVPIIKATTNCANVTNTARIESGEVVDRIYKLYQSSLQTHANDFLNFLKIKYSGWTVQLLVLPQSYMFIVNLTKTNENDVSIKYYYDQADYISSQLGVSLTPFTMPGDTTAGVSLTSISMNMITAMTSPILNYANPGELVSPPTSVTLDPKSIDYLSSSLIEPLSNYSFLSKYLPVENNTSETTNVILPSTKVL
jgi:hypothetical protein